MSIIEMKDFKDCKIRNEIASSTDIHGIKRITITTNAGNGSVIYDVTRYSRKDSFATLEEAIRFYNGLGGGREL